MAGPSSSCAISSQWLSSPDDEARDGLLLDGRGSDSSRANDTDFFCRAPFDTGRGSLATLDALVAWLRENDIQAPPETRVATLDLGDFNGVSDAREDELSRRLPGEAGSEAFSDADFFSALLRGLVRSLLGGVWPGEGE